MSARAAAAYLVVQGVAVFAWWLLMAVDETVREWFVGDRWETLRLYAPADLLTAGVGSILVGVAIQRSSSWRPFAHAALIGAYAVATLVAVSWAFEPVARPLGVVLMVPSFAITAWTWRAA